MFRGGENFDAKWTADTAGAKAQGPWIWPWFGMQLKGFHIGDVGVKKVDVDVKILTSMSNIA